MGGIQSVLRWKRNEKQKKRNDRRNRERERQTVYRITIVIQLIDKNETEISGQKTENPQTKSLQTDKIHQLTSKLTVKPK